MPVIKYNLRNILIYSVSGVYLYIKSLFNVSSINVVSLLLSRSLNSYVSFNTAVVSVYTVICNTFVHQNVVTSVIFWSKILKKSRKTKTLSIKIDFIKRFKSGRWAVDIANHYCLIPTPVWVIKNNAEKIKINIQKNLWLVQIKLIEPEIFFWRIWKKCYI